MNPTFWIPAVWAQFDAGNLTRAFRDVLLRLQKFDRGQGIWPAHETLADKARCSVRTVQDALAQARRLGLVDWVSGASRRISNRYTLILPKVAAKAGARLGRVAERTAAKVAAIGRALVGKMRRRTEQAISKRPLPGQGAGWAAWPQPQAPRYTVDEQLAIMAKLDQEKALTSGAKASSLLQPARKAVVR